MRTPFLHGCNYPWSADQDRTYYGLDFGANVWGTHLGVSTRPQRIADDFLRMAHLGFTIARWFVFCDGRSGIVYDERGLPGGLDPYVLQDLDVALEAAQRAHMRLCLVMLDHRWCFSGIVGAVADPASGETLLVRLPEGRSSVLVEPEGRTALIDAVCAPIVERYSTAGARADLAPAIAAYELMNEPDFVVEEWEQDLNRRVRRPVPFTALADAIARFNDLVHERSHAWTTIGGAKTRHLWAWDDPELGLDVVQIHTYPDRRLPDDDLNILGTRASDLVSRHPLLLGEFPCDGPHQHPPSAMPPPTTLREYLEFALADGYVGAWLWSFSGTDDYGSPPTEPLRQFALAHPDVVNRMARVDEHGADSIGTRR